MGNLKIQLIAKVEGVGSVRPAIQFLAAFQELAFKTHDIDRGEEGWKYDEPIALFNRLIEEAKELSEELDKKRPHTGRVIKECADVANFAVMIADVMQRRYLARAEEEFGS
jgi:NTP pyrophosphatase (non-canonical NTP hydrolase)